MPSETVSRGGDERTIGPRRPTRPRSGGDRSGGDVVTAELVADMDDRLVGRRVRMMSDVLLVDGRRLRYAVSDNVDAVGPEGPGTPPVWAVNIHGYFAGGGMYWRESARLAELLGWRVVNPSLPGFAGSDALEWGQVTIRDIANRVERLLDHLRIPAAVLLGHSMGAAVAVQLAAQATRRILGIVYRDGVATSAWRQRSSLLVRLLRPVAPNLAPMADIGLAMALDVPDILIGRRRTSTLRSILPDMHRNIRSVGRTLPVGAMLYSLDMHDAVSALSAAGVPVLPVWGLLDHLATSATAEEFATAVGRPVVWVPGGHSWMLARPQGQADVLRHLDDGRRFVDEVARRRALLDPSVAGEQQRASGAPALR